MNSKFGEKYYIYEASCTVILKTLKVQTLSFSRVRIMAHVTCMNRMRSLRNANYSLKGERQFFVFFFLITVYFSSIVCSCCITLSQRNKFATVYNSPQPTKLDPQ